VTELSSLPIWLENLLFPAGAVLLVLGVFLVVVGGIPLKRWWSPTMATLLQFWGATVFVEGLLCLAAVIELPWFIVGIIAVLALVAVPWAAWRHTRQLRIRQAVL
jgi:hypothetical protein